jgi:hypothetical protein
MRPLKSLSYIFSPLCVAIVVGYLLLKLKEIPAKYFVLIVVAGLALTLINSVIVVIKMRNGS